MAARRFWIIDKLRRDQRGSTTTIIAAAMIPALAAVGGGVDLARIAMVKSALQAGVDSAALAGARSCNITAGGSVATAANAEASTQVDAYFNSNFKKPVGASPGYMDTKNFVWTRKQVCTGTTIAAVDLIATVDVPMTLTKLFGGETFQVSAAARAETASTPSVVETVLVLDNTASMGLAPSSGSGTRIQALKDAANDFVRILYQNGETRPEVAIGVVPYNVTVNIGQRFGPASGSTANGSAVNALLGFTDQTSNVYRWKGCVFNDQTITNMSSDLNTVDVGAWDIRSTMPGTGTHPRVNPFFVPPTFQSNGTDYARPALQTPGSTYYAQGGAEEISGYVRLDNRFMVDATLANTPAYRNYFYERYIGLNLDGNTLSQTNADVIRSTGTANNAHFVWPTNGTNLAPPGSGWRVDPTRLTVVQSGMWPNPTQYGLPTAAAPNNGTTTTRSPNNQCPSAMMELQYGRTRSSYTTYINNNLAAIHPGSGTLHHPGLLWGYRMVQNDTTFPRTNPNPLKTPKRSIVFMTDGNFEFADYSGQTDVKWYDRLFGFYGRITQTRITWNGTNATSATTQAASTISTGTTPAALRTASQLRFRKVCHAAKRDGVAVYVVAFALNDTQSRTIFQECAPGKYYETSSATDLRNAFTDIANDIVDLHLTQ